MNNLHFEVNAELKRLIPPLTSEEFSQLENNILKDGVRDALVLGEYLEEDELILVLIDGHNRLEIAMENDLPYETITIAFDGYFAVQEWMIRHQFGRRNLNNYQRSTLALRLENVFSEKAKQNLSIAGESYSPKEGFVISQKVTSPIDTALELSKIANVGQQTISRVKKIEQSATPELKEQLEKGEVSINQAYQEIKKEEKIQVRTELIEKQKEDIRNNKITALSGLYDIISVDPPWNYGREYDPENSRVANPYPEMTTEEIKALKLPFSKDAIVFLWTTHKFLPDAFDILKEWGFEYKAVITWNKEKIGMGAWFRMQCEFCLFAIKGKPFWSNTTERDIITESRRQHSRKPDAFFEMVDKICVGRKLEYFSREQREGWEIFGNDTEKF